MINRVFNFFFFSSIMLYVIILSIAPMAGEDYGLTKIFKNESIIDRLIYSVNRSQMQINGWNARLGEQFSIFFLSMPHYFYIAANFLSLMSIFYLSSFFFAQKNDRFLYILISFACIFAFWPGMEVFFWTTASAGYLMPINICIAVLIPFCNQIACNFVFKNKCTKVAYFVLCLMAGVSFENVPVALVVSMLVAISVDKVSLKNGLPAILLTSLGWLVLVTAKSTSVRRMYYGSNSNYSDIHYILGRISDVAMVFINTSSTLLVCAIIGLTYLYKRKTLNYSICIPILCSFLTVGSMIASPYTEPRSFIIAWVVMFSVVCHAVYFSMRNKNYAIPLIVFFSSFLFSLYTFNVYYKYSLFMIQRESFILNESRGDLCKKGIYVHKITPDAPYRYINDRDMWYVNNAKTISDYYGCKILPNG